MLDINKIRAQFPILNRKVNGKDLVYFDNGATTQKPQSVIDAEANYYTDENSNVHRGVHFLSGLATDKFEETRNAIQAFIGAKHKHEIIFTKGTTDSINLVANGYRTLLSEGDEIIISELEHHSNIVPWQMCCEISGATLKVIPLLDNGSLDMNEFDNLLSKNTKLVSVSHISNALGTVNDIATIIAKAHKFNAKVMAHTHITAFFGTPTAPSDALIPAGVTVMTDHGTKTLTDVIKFRTNLKFHKQTYYAVSGAKYINSSFNKPARLRFRSCFFSSVYHSAFQIFGFLAFQAFFIINSTLPAGW